MGKYNDVPTVPVLKLHIYSDGKKSPHGFNFYPGLDLNYMQSACQTVKKKNNCHRNMFEAFSYSLVKKQLNTRAKKKTKNWRPHSRLYIYGIEKRRKK